MNQKAYYLSLLMAVFFVVNGCASNYKLTKTSLELQAIQSRKFETTKKVAFAATLSVFQDLGYIIESGDLDTGLITGKSPTKGRSLLFNTTQQYTKATGFVESIRKGTVRIRINFVNIFMKHSSYGQETRMDTPNEDPTLYQEVFDKIKKGIFVRSNFE